MGKIADALPKTVHLDKVTAGNILNALRSYRASIESSETDIFYHDEDLDALASAIQIAKFAESPAAVQTVHETPRERCGVGFNFEGARCILSAGHPGRHEFTR